MFDNKKFASFFCFFYLSDSYVPFGSVIIILLNLHIESFIHSLIQMTVL